MSGEKTWDEGIYIIYIENWEGLGKIGMGGKGKLFFFSLFLDFK